MQASVYPDLGVTLGVMERIYPDLGVALGEHVLVEADAGEGEGNEEQQADEGQPHRALAAPAQHQQGGVEPPQLPPLGSLQHHTDRGCCAFVLLVLHEKLKRKNGVISNKQKELVFAENFIQNND